MPRRVMVVGFEKNVSSTASGRQNVITVISRLVLGFANKQ